MRIAGDSTRVILTGDTAQHAPGPRGDPFRLMQQYAGLKVAEVTEIRRQQGEDYRAAVIGISKQRGICERPSTNLDDLERLSKSQTTRTLIATWRMIFAA